MALSTVFYPTLLAGAIAILLVAFIVDRVRSYRRLSHIPGPTLGALSKYWMLRATTSGRNHLLVAEVNAKYGRLARIGPNNLITSDPDLIRRMNAPRSDYRRGDWYNAMRFKPGFDNTLSERREDRHKELREKMAAGYAGKENPGLEQTIDERLLDLVALIERNYISEGTSLKRMDFARIAQFFTLDVISDVAFGVPFGDVKDDEDKFEYIKTTEENLPVLILMAILPQIHRFLETTYLMALLAPSAKDKLGLGRIIGIAQERVEDRFRPEAKGIQQWDMLGSFIRHGLTQEEAESESVLQILAGSDTTATAIRSTFLHFLTSPMTLSKLRAEIDTAISDGRISSSPISDADARRLPYLQACIKEGLRIWPPITGIMDKVVPAEGDMWNDVYIPGGTKIGYCAWGVHRNVDIFGPDADLFRPERWFERQGEQLQAMERNMELIFGYGRFSCLGKNVAMIELNKTFVELLRRFDFSLTDPTNPWKSVNVGLFLQSEMWVRVTRREDEARA